MIEELIARVFATRDASHLEHWRTKSFSQHVALGDLYDSLIEAIDKLVEAHQGAFDLVGNVPLEPTKEKDIITLLEEDLLFISTNRQKITGKLPGLDNILQELEGVYFKALYKLRNLK